MTAQEQHPTTTHAGYGSGRPRLILGVDEADWDGEPPREFGLLEPVTTIGSGADCHLRLDGLMAAHADIRHNPADEYVLFLFDVPKGGGEVLRTGARVELGEWRFTFFREEFADHGRPYGGRQGGELEHQQAQPDRVIEAP
ncbi:MAG: hypothetical protein JWN36_2520 [Microbacteriaceae bacterium]|nr:hypothetical protein [Microbacteriaceae bacterium]